MELYSDERVKVCTLSGIKDICISSVLKTADKELTFLYRKENPFAASIKEEAYIRTEEDEFVIKQIEPTDTWYTCTAVLNIEELEGQQFPTGFTTTEQTVEQCINTAITGTGWTVVSCEIAKKRTITIDSNCSGWDVIQQAITTYRCEIKIDSLEKTIAIYEKIGEDKGCYFIERINLKKMRTQSNSYDFCTRLICVGKDGLMLNVNGKNYLENYQYSKKIKTCTWKDERYIVASSLQEDGEAKLDELSKPYKSYTAEIKNLAAQSEEYAEIFSYSLGDMVMLISITSSIRESHRIVKTYEYPLTPSENKVELANTRLTFEEVQKQEQELS